MISLSKYHNLGAAGSGFPVITHFSGIQAQLNTYLHQVFDRYLPPDQSALASGTLIGAQGTITAQFKQDLIAAGLIHVVVASGYNLTVVTGFVQSVVGKIFSKKFALVLSLGSIWWYVFLALSNPAIVRAGWMASIAVIAKLCGRPNSVWRVLLLSVLFLCAVDPSMLVNISFQLSVFSTVGVLAINQKTANAVNLKEVSRGESTLLGHVRCENVVDPSQRSNPTTDHHNGRLPLTENKRSHHGLLQTVTEVLKENFRTTVGANLFTLPIILFWFGRVSLIAVVANTVLLWIIPHVMSISSVFLVMALVSPTGGRIFAIPVHFLCSIFLVGTHFFARLPFASFDIPKLSFMHVCLCYGMLFLFFFKAHWFEQLFYRLKRRIFLPKRSSMSIY